MFHKRLAPLVPKKVPETGLRYIFSIVFGSKHKWKRVTGTFRHVSGTFKAQNGNQA